MNKLSFSFFVISNSLGNYTCYIRPLHECFAIAYTADKIDCTRVDILFKWHHSMSQFKLHSYRKIMGSLLSFRMYLKVPCSKLHRKWTSVHWSVSTKRQKLSGWFSHSLSLSISPRISFWLYKFLRLSRSSVLAPRRAYSPARPVRTLMTMHALLGWMNCEIQKVIIKKTRQNMCAVSQIWTANIATRHERWQSVFHK